MNAIIFLLCLAIFLLGKKAKISFACMTILVGRSASSTGEVLVAHNEDAPGRYTIQTHLVSKKRRHPGEIITFENNCAPLTLNETRTSLFWLEAKTYSPEKPAPSFCDFYANGHGVIICSNNCEFSREDKPELTNGGIAYGLRRLVAEKARTAREALEIACGLVKKYGYASSGRSYAFADKDEIFVLQIVHGKHFAIVRVPDDEVAVIPNHYTIREPENKSELVTYAENRGWLEKNSDFDFARVYQDKNSFGLEKNTYRHVKAFEILLEMDLSDLLKTQWQPLPFSIKPARKVEISTLKKILRSHSHSEKNSPHFKKPIGICNCDTLSSVIVQIRHNPDRILLRSAVGNPCVSPYIGWYLGISEVPRDYEDIEPEKSLAEHFLTTPENMDWKNNAWFRAMEIQAATNILYDEKSSQVHEAIEELENRIENKLADLDPQIELRLRNEPGIARAMMEGAIMMGAEAAEKFTQSMKKELGIITGEALTCARYGENFKIRVPKKDLGELEKVFCGTSYDDFSKWSTCEKISSEKDFYVLEFSSGEWLENAAPCFTDLYMLLIDSDGTKHAGSIRIQVRQ